MPTLHLVNKPASNPAFERCLTMTLFGDNVLLIEDGVYNALPAAMSAHVVDGLSVFALRRDVDARGLSQLVNERVVLVDEGGFVDLVAASQPIVTWG